MANTPRTGLDYYPMEVGFFDDIKIRKLIKYQSGKATPVYHCLLCIIYKNGYYMRWDDELPFMISEKTGYEEGFIQEVIKCCFDVGLLSKKMFEESRILTSKGIQVRYSDICKTLRRKANIDTFSLINVADIPNNVTLIVNNVAELPQKKGKEIKGKEIDQGAGNFFEIGGRIIKSLPSEYLVKHDTKFFEAKMMTVFKGRSPDPILLEFDKRVAENFSDLNHFRNAFVYDGEQLLSLAKPNQSQSQSTHVPSTKHHG